RPAPPRCPGAKLPPRPRPPPRVARPRAPEPAGRPPAASLVAHVQDLVLAHAAGRPDLGHVVRALADQRAGDRAGHRDPAGLDVRLILADDLVGHRLARLHILELDGGAEHHAA